MFPCMCTVLYNITGRNTSVIFPTCVAWQRSPLPRSLHNMSTTNSLVIEVIHMTAHKYALSFVMC